MFFKILETACLVKSGIKLLDGEEDLSLPAKFGNAANSLVDAAKGFGEFVNDMIEFVADKIDELD